MNMRLVNRRLLWVIPTILMLLLTACGGGSPGEATFPAGGTDIVDDAGTLVPDGTLPDSTEAVMPEATLPESTPEAGMETTVPEMTEGMPTATAEAGVPQTGSEMMEAEIMVVTDPVLGEILVDAEGKTLYMFTKDEAGKSNCTGDCLVNWPPLLSQGSPTAGNGVDETLLGTAALADGTMIVTYNGMPLYYYMDDTAPGDTKGQGLNTAWYVVAPDGTPVEKAAETVY